MKNRIEINAQIPLVVTPGAVAYGREKSGRFFFGGKGVNEVDSLEGQGLRPSEKRSKEGGGALIGEP